MKKKSCWNYFLGWLQCKMYQVRRSLRLYTNLVVTSKVTMFDQFWGHFFDVSEYFTSDFVFEWEDWTQWQGIFFTK